jgi:putative ABC transport system substrate-binding protein
VIRRHLIALLGGAVVAWPFAAHAQQAAMPVIGLLGSGSRGSDVRVSSFRQGLSETGTGEGRNAAIE